MRKTSSLSSVLRLSRTWIHAHPMPCSRLNFSHREISKDHKQFHSQSNPWSLTWSVNFHIRSVLSTWALLWVENSEVTRQHLSSISIPLEAQMTMGQWILPICLGLWIMHVIKIPEQWVHPYSKDCEIYLRQLPLEVKGTWFPPCILSSSWVVSDLMQSMFLIAWLKRLGLSLRNDF